MGRYETVDYEIASECCIAGVLDYDTGNIKIKFSFLTIMPDTNGLYRYLIKIEGYGELDDIDKLLALLAVYFGCRFFKLSRFPYTFNIKYLYPFAYHRCHKKNLPTIFDTDGTEFQRSRVFDSRLKEWLDKFANHTISAKKKQKFITGCKLYLSALQNVGLNINHHNYDGYGDHGRIQTYLMLVSAIEAVLENYENNMKLLSCCFKDMRKLLEDAYSLSADSKTEQLKKFDSITSEYKENTSGIAEGFKDFITEYSSGYAYLKHNIDVKAPPVYISQDKLEKVLSKIYDARSKYLHSGTPMILSLIMYNDSTGDDWHIHPSYPASGIKLPKKTTVKNDPPETISEKIRLPYEWWFEGIVRHCLIEYLLRQTTINSD
jgi:hypothetical protein